MTARQGHPGYMTSQRAALPTDTTVPPASYWVRLKQAETSEDLDE